MDSAARFIHLLYAPTKACNMACRYCYLGDGTHRPVTRTSPLPTLARTVDALLAESIVPFNISFHGGEPTAISARHLGELFAFVRDYYDQHGDRIRDAGLPVNPIHIKTNLFNFHRRRALFERYGVSISGSVDLPLSLHARYRRDRAGRSTLPTIERNLRLLADYPFQKKLSCVVTRAHVERMDELVADIWYLHRDVGLDMTRFNVMIGFDSEMMDGAGTARTPELAMLSADEQVRLFDGLTHEFTGTELEPGLRKHWFAEFTPDYCCSAVNCGDKFFLLQGNGDVYSCPRGQSSPRFLYGNVFDQPISEIVAFGARAIRAVESQRDLDPDCAVCSFLPYCNEGCPFVRQQTGLGRSYTCALQRRIYLANPERYPPYDVGQVRRHAERLRFENHLPQFSADEVQMTRRRSVTPELFEDDNAIQTLIREDELLGQVFSASLFEMRVDGVVIPLESPVLSTRSAVALIRDDSEVSLLVREGLFAHNCKREDEVNNALLIMLLRNTMVTYGDEGRSKQEHLADLSLYKQSLLASSVEEEGGARWVYDLMPLLRAHRHLFLDGVRNNLFVTTKTLREYHYRKQQRNAFYHIQAINLPFPSVEFYWR